MMDFNMAESRSLAPHTRLDGLRDAYEIERFLGLGLTAQVYLAHRESDQQAVALKVLRADASQISTDNFWQEAQILSELRYHGATATPQVLERQSAGDIHFLALDYVDHAIFRPLDKLSENESLPEAQVLEIARQTLVLLDILHTKVERTYTDMQLKNFLWDGQTLRVIDWNHVSAPRQYIQEKELHYFGVKDFTELAQRDLVKWGTFLYQLLTGKAASPQGEPRGLLARRAGGRWDGLSAATRQLLVRALHPDPTQRYASAAEFLAAVETVQALWRAPIDSDAARKEYSDLRKAEMNAETAARLERLWVTLDMLERRGEADATLLNYKHQVLTRWLAPGDTGAWSSGKAFYDRQQYLTAISTWETEATAQARSALYRWLALAQTGAEKKDDFVQIKADLEKLVALLSEEPGRETYAGKAVDWLAAQQQWADILTTHPWVKDAPIGVLGREVAVAGQIAAAREAEALRQWAQAVTAYETAERGLEQIAHAACLREEYGWLALPEWLAAATAKRDALAQADAQAQDLRAVFARSAEEGLARLRLRFQGLPENERLAQFCLNYAGEREIAPELALSVVEIALLWGQTPALREVLEAKRDELRQTVLAQREQKEAEEQRTRLAAEFGELKSQIETAVLESDWAGLTVAVRSFVLTPALREQAGYIDLQQTLQAQYQELLSNDDFTAAMPLHETLRELDPEGDKARETAWNERMTAVEREWQEKREAIEQARVAETDLQAKQAALAAMEAQLEKTKTEIELLHKGREQALREMAVERSELQAEHKQIERERERWHDELRSLEAEMEERQHKFQWMLDRERDFQVELDHARAEAARAEDALREKRAALAEIEREEQTQRQAAESVTQQVLEFQQWAREQAAVWQALEQVAAPDYADLQDKSAAALKEAQDKYVAIAQEASFTQWEKWVAQQQAMWQKDADAQATRQQQWNEQQKQLDEAASKLDATLTQIGQLTRESLEQARQSLQEAQEWLQETPLPEYQARQRELTARAALLQELLTHAEQVVLPETEDLRNKLATFKAALKSNTDPSVTEKALWAVVQATSARYRTRENYWQTQLALETPIFPALDTLLQEITHWVYLLPFSAAPEVLSSSGAGSPGLTDKDVQRILNGFEHRFQILAPEPSLPSEPVSPATEPSPLPSESPPRSRNSMWVYGVSALVFIILLCVGMELWRTWVGSPSLPTEVVLSTAAPPPTAKVGTNTPDSVGYIDTPTPIAPTATLTPAPTETPTPTPTSTSTPIPMPDLMLTWPQDVPLYDMPPLTLTASSGWVLTATTEITYVRAIAASGAIYRIEVQVADVVSASEQLGAFTFISSAGASWRPDPEGQPLRPGEHQVWLRVTDAQSHTMDVEMTSFTVVTPTRVTVLQANRVRTTPNTCGMDVDYTIAPGTELEIIGKVKFGTIVLFQAQRSGNDQVLWVPTGMGGVMEGTGIYIEPMGRWTLAEILPLIPDVEARQKLCPTPTPTCKWQWQSIWNSTTRRYERQWVCR